MTLGHLGTMPTASYLLPVQRRPATQLATAAGCAPKQTARLLWHSVRMVPNVKLSQNA